MTGCFHGGAFWEEIGPGFQQLPDRSSVINADVLDAWFPPAPSVIRALGDAGEWQFRTSPPTNAEGVRSAISVRLGLCENSILVGAGSSHLIYLALLHWLQPESRVLLIEPSYGEYEHVSRHIVGACVDRFVLNWRDGFAFDVERWAQRIEAGEYDLVVLVNPNNPTGTCVPRGVLKQILPRIPVRTKLWVDEAYMAYAGDAGLVEEATRSPNVFVVRSMSKGFALSGLRVAYLIGNPHSIADLARRTAPWSVSLPAQIAAVAALGESTYYRAAYDATAELRNDLVSRLASLGGELFPSCANWILWRLPDDASSAEEVVVRARGESVYIRNAGLTAPSLDDRFVRIAVKDEITNERIALVIASAVRP